jgi:wyosine [tRNA(Phe)-imidazoG37] synthetase (radical SAM superfamily)
MSNLSDTIASLRSDPTAVPRPVFLELSLFGGCNFACVQCHQLQHIGEAVQLHGLQGPRALDLASAVRALESARELGVELVNLCGRGEPTLFPGIATLVRTVKSLGMKGILTTNGSRWSAPLLDALAESAFDQVDLSLYAGDQAGFERIVRPKGGVRLHDVLAGAHALAARCPRTRLSLVVILQAGMMQGLPALFDFMHALQPADAKFVFAFPYENSRRVAPQALATRRTAFLAELAQAADRLAPRWRGSRWHARLLELQSELIGMPQTDTIASTYAHIPCYAGQWALFIADDGTLRPCSNSNLVLGSVAEGPLDRQWHGPRYEAFRSLARSHIRDTATPIPKSHCDQCGWARMHRDLHKAITSEVPAAPGLMVGEHAGGAGAAAAPGGDAAEPA